MNILFHLLAHAQLQLLCLPLCRILFRLGALAHTHTDVLEVYDCISSASVQTYTHSRGYAIFEKQTKVFSEGFGLRTAACKLR